MNAGEACNREVVVIGPDETVREAVRLMREHHVGDVVVTETTAGGRVPVGILTDRDVVIEVLAEDVAAGSVNVGDVMTTDPVVVDEGESLFDAVRRMREKGVRRVPVVDRQGHLVGILTVDDVVGLLAELFDDLAWMISREQERERRLRSRP